MRKGLVGISNPEQTYVNSVAASHSEPKIRSLEGVGAVYTAGKESDAEFFGIWPGYCGRWPCLGWLFWCLLSVSAVLDTSDTLMGANAWLDRPRNLNVNEELIGKTTKTMDYGHDE